jgi:hypothetical protein
MKSNPIGKRLPSISGETLSRVKLRFPENLIGFPAVLLVAYRRGTQPDLDRWIEFISVNAPQLLWYEVPAIPSLIWRPLAGWIDSGMRSGVPQEKWLRVVTLYEDAAKLRDFIGDNGRDMTHLVVLNSEGVVVWFNSNGYSEETASELLRLLRRLDLGAQ